MQGLVCGNLATPRRDNSNECQGARANVSMSKPTPERYLQGTNLPPAAPKNSDRDRFPFFCTDKREHAHHTAMVVGASCFHTSKNQMFRLLVQLCVVVIVLRGALVDSFLRPHAAQLARTSCRTSCCYSVLDSLQRAFENPEVSHSQSTSSKVCRYVTTTLI